MNTINYLKNSNTVLPHKMYQLAYQVVSEFAFDTYVNYDTQTGIEKILGALEGYLFLNMGRVLVPNHDRTKLCIRYAHGIEKAQRFINYDIDQGITGLIYTSKQAIYADDLDTNSMYLGKLCQSTYLPYSNPAISGVPIFNSKNEIRGVLCVNHGYRDNKELSEILSVLENTATLIGLLLSRDNIKKLAI